MSSSVRVIAFLLIAALAGCVNAPGDGSGNGGASAANADVTADSRGGETVNGSVRVPAGQKTGDVGTVNGSINIDDNATLADANTVNGSITVGQHAAADSLTTVNGSIALGDGSRVARAATTVNGRLTLRDGAQVDGAVTTVNGAIDLHGAAVGGGITTVNGDINVWGASRVAGGILVKKPLGGGWFDFEREPRVVIGPGAVVSGDLRFERKVQLYVSDKATIGPVIGATPVKFSGASPPG
ncbi:MAG TPA: hypothetical protein VMU67_17205 [Steroidobacteraceae bacterium]|nr:hypothetical protein [Steroidobacteraceae bacterium]